MTCPDPPSVANGYIVSSNSTAVTYACNDLFGLSGYAEVVCSGGTWGTLPYCFTSWNRNNNNFIATGNVTSIFEEIAGADYTVYMLYGVGGVVGLLALALLAGLLLCWLHQCGCYDGPAVGFGGSYVYTDRRCCYWGDLNVNCCNFKCNCCKRRCCRYVRKKSHGKIHFQLTPTPEQVALQKYLMKKKKKRRFGPVPCCLRAGRCLLGCLLCCCRWKRRKAKQMALADEEKMLNITEVQEPKEAETIINVEPVKEDEKQDEVPDKSVVWAKPTETKPEPEKKKEPVGPPLMAIREAPKPKKKEETPEPEQKKEEKPKPIGPPLMVIRQPPKPKKKKTKPKQEKSKDIVPSQDFMNVVESTDNPFGNVDVKPSKRAGSFMAEANNNKVTPSSNARQFENNFQVGKGGKVVASPSANATHLTFAKSLKSKVAKWSDMDDGDIWKTQPQQNLFSPEAPIKTRKTAAEIIPLASLFQISGKPKPKKNQNQMKPEKKEDEGDNFGLPTVGLKMTRISR